ncbi:pickpocket protein 28 [Drosophila busckii]|uniref:pickpocket protein 28 n=1 Tax=Drosophila busckii TaxID=30019 RepID=UPI00083F0C04|nr:pickpocket protein 28 [Drosophila busckii]
MKFPTVAICEVNTKNELGEDVEAYVTSLGKGIREEYNFDVEAHISFILFPSQYTHGTIKARCLRYEDCDNCAKCPKTGYRKLVETFGANCTEIFEQCWLAGKEFDCCQYFLPLYTPYGTCFMLNSLQNNHPGSQHWMSLELDRSQKPELQVVTSRSIQVSLLNEEDIPNTALKGISLVIQEGQDRALHFHSELMANDVDVRDIPIEARNCRFPDETLPWSLYHAYSFSTCISDCTRIFQEEVCKCNSYLLNPYADARFVDCGLAGYSCLEASSMIIPDVKKVMRFNSSRLQCSCLPSCAEGDIRTVYESVLRFNPKGQEANITLVMPVWPTDQYRRQVLRSRLDGVVSIGGILGLFLGASILSGIEFIYYFTLRAANTALMARRAQQLKQT